MTTAHDLAETIEAHFSTAVEEGEIEQCWEIDVLDVCSFKKAKLPMVAGFVVEMADGSKFHVTVNKVK